MAEAAERRGSVTIAEVARHAGVAVSTVSYALSGKRAISAVTRERVLASIRVLGYHPNAGARALASRRSNVLALVLPPRSGEHAPVLMPFTAAVVATARSAGYDVLLVAADEGVDGLRRVAAGAMVDGLVVTDVGDDDARLPVLRELAGPSVLVGSPAGAGGLTRVAPDRGGAAALCVEHLAGLGHRAVALLGVAAAAVQDGFVAAARRWGLRAVVRCGGEQRRGVRDEAVALLDRDAEVTGLVVAGESAVGEVPAVLSAGGRRVPGDVSVVGLCDDDAAVRSDPPLTSVAVPAEEVGRAAVSLLVRMLGGESVPGSSLVRPRLTVRASTAAMATAGSVIARR